MGYKLVHRVESWELRQEIKSKSTVEYMGEKSN
jgi:hypothetical protein